MANNFGALLNSILLHSLADDLRDNLRPLLGLAMNLGDLQKDGTIVRDIAPGSTITIKDWSAPFTPYTVDPAVGYVPPDYTAKAGKTVTLPEAVIATSMRITPAEYRVLVGADKGTAYDELRKKANRMMVYGLASKMVTDFLATVTQANYPNHTVNVVGAFTRSTEIDIDTALFDRKLMSRENATTILNSTAFGEWSKDHIAVHTNTGQDQSARVSQGGRRSSVTSQTLWRTTVGMPAASNRGVSFTQTSHLFVSRVPDEPTYDQDPVSLQTVVGDPDDTGTTGPSFLSRLWKDGKTGNMQWDMAIIYKFEPFQPEALQRIKTVADA
jgi:hypothetical protein